MGSSVAFFETLRVTHRSSYVGPGSVFFALQGVREHGARYIPEAVARGAVEIVIEADYALEDNHAVVCFQHGVLITRTPSNSSIRDYFAERSAQAYGYPARSLVCIGITGTKGKTTSTTILHHILSQAGIRVALLNSLEHRIGDRSCRATLTTEHADYIQAFLASARDAGMTHVVIEVAAQAVTLRRIHGIEFFIIAFLNFSSEHGEFYTTQEDYWNAKVRFLEAVAPDGYLIMPSGDDRFMRLELPSTVRISYSKAYDPTWTLGTLDTPWVCCRYRGDTYICPRLLGDYNSQNLLVAVMIAQRVGIAPSSIQEALKSFMGVPGRMELYTLSNGAIACIDYAHNPASYEALLSSLRSMAPYVAVVCGAGGDRDTSRRASMGRIAAIYSDRLFLTTDNPRSEDPAAIVSAMMAGIPQGRSSHVVIELDRALAIRRACIQAPPGGVVALLGKGPDEYQIVKGQVYPFSEKALLADL